MFNIVSVCRLKLYFYVDFWRTLKFLIMFPEHETRLIWPWNSISFFSKTLLLFESILYTVTRFIPKLKVYYFYDDFWRTFKEFRLCCQIEHETRLKCSFFVNCECKKRDAAARGWSHCLSCQSNLFHSWGTLLNFYMHKPGHDTEKIK